VIKRFRREAEEQMPKMERVTVLEFDRKTRGYYVAYRGRKVGPVWTESGYRVMSRDALAETEAGRIKRLIA
jgi:hypothetical protein